MASGTGAPGTCLAGSPSPRSQNQPLLLAGGCHHSRPTPSGRSRWGLTLTGLRALDSQSGLGLHSSTLRPWGPFGYQGGLAFFPHGLPTMQRMLSGNHFLSTRLSPLQLGPHLPPYPSPNLCTGWAQEQEGMCTRPETLVRVGDRELWAKRPSGASTRLPRSPELSFRNLSPHSCPSLKAATPPLCVGRGR